MATSDVLSLFGNMPTQEQLADQFLSGMMVSPGQMAQLSLPQQITATMRNAGANIGYAGGRMLGGATTDMVRAQAADQIMRDISAMNFTSDADMYGELSRRLAQAGMAQDALKARSMALDARRTEQTMRLQEQQDKRAEAEAKRQEDLFPFARSKAVLEVKKLEDSMKGLEQLIAEEKAKASPDPDRIKDLTTQRDQALEKHNMEKQKVSAQLAHWKAIEAQGASNIALQKAKLDAEAYNKPIPFTFRTPGWNTAMAAQGVKEYQTIPAAAFMDPKTKKFLGRDGTVYDSLNEAVSGSGMLKELGIEPSQQRPGPVAPSKPVSSGGRTPITQFD